MKTLKNVSGEIKAFLHTLRARRIYNVDVKHAYGANSRCFYELRTSKESDAIEQWILDKKVIRQLSVSIFRSSDRSTGKLFNFVHVYYYVNGHMIADKTFKYSNKMNFEKDYTDWCFDNHLCYLIRW